MTPDDEVLDRFDRSVAGFSRVLGEVGAQQWTDPTPCSEWDVRALVNHVCGEQRWMAPLLDGQTMADVGDSLAGDLLGDDPVAAYTRAAANTRAALARHCDLAQTVQLSGGPTAVSRYCDEVGLDTLIHTWDLARAVGADETLPVDLVEAGMVAVQPWIQPDGVPGVFAAPVVVAVDADPATRLLGLLGRQP